MKRLWFKVWAAVMGILALLFVIGLIQYGAQQSTYDDELREANARVRLYTAASGHKLGDPSIERKLGEDLYAHARQRGGQLDSFLGDSNAYGGISDAIGEDPFHGTNCAECGPLKFEWLKRLEAAVQGDANIQELAERPDEPTNWSGTIVTLALVWLFALPVLWGVSSLLERRRRWQHYSSEDRGLIAALNQQLERGQADPELLQLREGLQDALRERAEAGQDERNELLIKRIKTEARDRLDALEAGNEYLERRP